MENKKILYALVIKEAKDLRQNLRPKEKDNLNFNTLNPNGARDCIYGQATGHCFSKRANSLIRKHCTRVYTVTQECNRITTSVLNGSPKGKRRKNDYFDDKIDFFSPIEVFITKKGQKRNTRKLIDYIKGKSDKLELI